MAIRNILKNYTLFADGRGYAGELGDTFDGIRGV